MIYNLSISQKSSFYIITKSIFQPLIFCTMKKLLTSFVFILAIIAICSQDSKAQLYEKGKKVADAGLYFPSGGTIVKAGLSYGVADNLGVGVQAQYASGFGSAFGLFGKVNYDFAPAIGSLGDKVFLYGGGTAGTYFQTGSQFAILGQLGGGYMFSDKIGANAEIQFGIVNSSGSQFGLGIVYKLD